MFCKYYKLNHGVQRSQNGKLTLLDPSAVQYLNSSPRYNIGGCYRLRHKVPINTALRSPQSIDLFRRDAATWMIFSTLFRKYVINILMSWPLMSQVSDHLQGNYIINRTLDS